MVRIDSQRQVTRKERLATVIALALSVAVHLFVFLGGLQIYHWVEEERKKERLMIIRRVTEVKPAAEPAAPAPPSRPKAPPNASVAESGPEPPEETTESPTETLEGEFVEETQEAPALPSEEIEESTVSVVTDLGAATFSVAGPIEFEGAGTFWLKKGVPPGEYTATFHPVVGYNTPPIRSKTLDEGGRIVFVGKYTRSVEVEVNVGIPGATFQIHRPDGKLLPMHRGGRAFFENIPLGMYTIVYGDVTGYLAPSPDSKRLGPGGRLNFVGIYLPSGGGRGKAAPKQVEAELDKRVQLIVTSYPPTSIEESFGYLRYPEVVIKRSNFQKGWCQVYLIVRTDREGDIDEVVIQRPRPEEQSQYRQLINTVEKAIRQWDFDAVKADIHVDARFYVE